MQSMPGTRYPQYVLYARIAYTRVWMLIYTTTPNLPTNIIPTNIA